MSDWKKAISDKCKTAATISIILSLLFSLLMLVLLLSTDGNETSSIIFAFIFSLITVFIILFAIIFCINLMIYGFSNLNESTIKNKNTKRIVTKSIEKKEKITFFIKKKMKDYDQYFKKLKEDMEKIRKKNAKLCPKCNKELGGFFTGSWGYFKGIRYCAVCVKVFRDKANKEDEREKSTTRSNQQYRGSIEEIKCTCKQCGHTWHYLPKEKKDANCQSTLNACVGCAACGSFLGFYSMNKAHDYKKHAEAFDKCQKCGSRNFTQESHYYDKK